MGTSPASKKMTEVEVAQGISEWLRNHGWDVYPEVQLPSGGRVDIVAVQGPVVWLIETKTSLGLGVLGQAYRHTQFYTGYISVGVPHREVTWFENQLLHDYGIGLLTVKKFGCDGETEYEVRENVQPRLFRAKIFRKHYRVQNYLDPDQKNYVAGSRHGYSTPFNRTLKRVQEYLNHSPGATLKQIVADIDHHYSTPGSARSCLRGWMELRPEFRCEQDGNQIKWYNDDKK